MSTKTLSRAEKIAANKIAITRLLEESIVAEKPNATFKDPMSVKDMMALPIVSATLHSLVTAQAVYLLGSAGIGKTSFVTKFLAPLGYRVVVLNAAQISIENLVIPFPKIDEETNRRVLETVLFDMFKPQYEGEKIIIFIDEIGRADSSIGNMLMELLQERTLAGHPLTGVEAVLAADNPAGAQYGRMSSLDFAQADRLATFVLSSNDTPWARALAAKFSNTNLNAFFKEYYKLDSKVREILSPRVLENVIEASEDGLPLRWVLPMVSGVRQELITATGQNVSNEVLSKLAAALGRTNPATVSGKVEKAVSFMLRTGKNIYLEGGPGIGKTSFIKRTLKKLNVGYEYDSAPLLQPEDLNVPFPSADGTGLELMPANKFLRKDPWAYVLDEINRGSRRTLNSIMPILQEKAIGGIVAEGLIGTIALNNPKNYQGMKLDVGKNDLAQATRFALSLELDASDIPSTSYLYDQFGEDIATPFLDWWKEDLDDVGRALCTPRCLERMIELHLTGMDVRAGLPYVSGAFVGVPTIKLMQRLESNAPTSFRQIIEDMDEWLIKLAVDELDDPLVHASVFSALVNAELQQLESAYDQVVTLATALSKQQRISLVRHDKGGSDQRRQKFWIKVIQATAKVA